MALQTRADKSAKIYECYECIQRVFVSYSKVKYYFNELSWVGLQRQKKKEAQKKNKYLFSNAAASDRQKVNNVTFNHRQMPSVCQVALCHGITDFLLCLLLLLLLLLPDIIHMLDEGSSAFPGLISNRITSPAKHLTSHKNVFPTRSTLPSVRIDV